MYNNFVMRTAYRNYQYQDTVFEGKIVFMRCRNMTLRADVENHRLRFSCPYGTPVSTIDKTISKALPDLVKKLVSRPKPIQGGTACKQGGLSKLAICTKSEFQSRARMECIRRADGEARVGRAGLPPAQMGNLCQNILCRKQMDKLHVSEGDIGERKN